MTFPFHDYFKCFIRIITNIITYIYYWKDILTIKFNNDVTCFNSWFLSWRISFWEGGVGLRLLGIVLLLIANGIGDTFLLIGRAFIRLIPFKWILFGLSSLGRLGTKFIYFLVKRLVSSFCFVLFIFNFDWIFRSRIGVSVHSFFWYYLSHFLYNTYDGFGFSRLTWFFDYIFYGIARAHYQSEKFYYIWFYLNHCLKWYPVYCFHLLNLYWQPHFPLVAEVYLSREIFFRI